MSLRTLLSSALLVSGAAASSSLVAKAAAGEVELCGTNEPSDDHKAFSQAMMERERVLLRQKEPFAVDVVYHVVMGTQAEADGISDELISQQMDIVNAAYSPHGVSFNLIETTRTVNAGWASGSGIPTMKAELRQGNYATLNIYTVDNIGGGVLGFCPFPEQVTEGDATFTNDGCTIAAGTMPGGDIVPYNQGGTLVHEIGHWMDLYHTFQDGCFPGDRVDDTPPMSSTPGRACDPNVVYDTCPNDPGTDPIHNWMNYTGDQCWEEFTAGQEARMHSAWETYRNAAL